MFILEATRDSHLVRRIVAIMPTLFQLPAPSISIPLAFLSGDDPCVVPAWYPWILPYECLPKWPSMVHRSSWVSFDTDLRIVVFLRPMPDSELRIVVLLWPLRDSDLRIAVYHVPRLIHFHFHFHFHFRFPPNSSS